MSVFDTIKAKFNEAIKEVENAEGTPTVVADNTDEKLQALETKFSAELAAFKTEQEAKYAEALQVNEQLKTDLATKTAEVEAKETEAEKFSTDAAEAAKADVLAKASAKVEELIEATKVVPAKREELKAVFAALIESDSKATFNDKDIVDVLFNLFDGQVSLKEEIPNSGEVLNGNQNAEDKAHIERAKAWAKKNSKK